MTSLATKLLDPFTSGPDRPPGPRGWEMLKYQVRFFRNQVETMRSLRAEYGDIVAYRIGPYQVYVVCDSDAIEEVLLGNDQSFHKDALTHELDDLLGQGLLTAEDDFWRRQRKLIAPALQRNQIAHYADIFVEETERLIDTWRDGERRDFHDDMMGVTLRVVVRALFGQELDERLDAIGQALEATMTYFDKITHSAWGFLPDAVPTPFDGEYERAKSVLDGVIGDLIDTRRSQPPGEDLLWCLLEAADEEGDSMTDEQLRSEVLTLFLAGHETTALALSYTWHLLTKNPATAERLREEVDEVLGDRRATAEDAKKLPFTEAVVKESMRLYPPAWIIGREATEDVEIGGWTVPEGAQVVMPQCVTHRDPEWFEAPQDFRPERWLGGELEDRLPRFVYFPFGGGARICIGNHFAMMEAILITATIAQRAELETRTPDELELLSSVTLRPVTPIEMVVRRR